MTVLLPTESPPTQPSGSQLDSHVPTSEYKNESEIFEENVSQINIRSNLYLAFRHIGDKQKSFKLYLVHRISPMHLIFFGLYMFTLYIKILNNYHECTWRQHTMTTFASDCTQYLEICMQTASGDSRLSMNTSYLPWPVHRGHAKLFHDLDARRACGCRVFYTGQHEDWDMRGWPSLIHHSIKLVVFKFLGYNKTNICHYINCTCKWIAYIPYLLY